MALTKEQLSEAYHAEALLELLERQYTEPDHEATICARFGCGRRLTLLEALYGDCCPDHQPAAVSCWDGDVPALVSY